MLPLVYSELRHRVSDSGRPEMDPARWRRINDIFQDTIERAAEARQALLVDLCAGDVGLREEVERRVRAHERANGFLARPARSRPSFTARSDSRSFADSVRAGWASSNP
jgi:hypothetical protein